MTPRRKKRLKTRKLQSTAVRKTRHRVRPVWLFVRSGLQLVGLLSEQHKSLHLAVQALVVTGDLAVMALDKLSR